MAKASKTPKTLRTYAGPVYHHGIQLPGEQGLVRPAHMTAEEVTAFLVKHPEYSTWWQTPSEDATDTNATDESGND